MIMKQECLILNLNTDLENKIKLKSLEVVNQLKIERKRRLLVMVVLREIKRNFKETKDLDQKEIIMMTNLLQKKK